MNFDEYQRLAHRTSSFHGDDLGSSANLTMAALGLTGEAGEAADIVKKTVFHGHPLDRDKLAKEVGDVLWYVAEMASALGMPLSEIAAANLEKLRRRYPEGFSTDASVARADVSSGVKEG
jgi:NTP pyrophosphatase (non-canonical NTP hydrolase)